jgi:hypothetical protein
MIAPSQALRPIGHAGRRDVPNAPAVGRRSRWLQRPTLGFLGLLLLLSGCSSPGETAQPPKTSSTPASPSTQPATSPSVVGSPVTGTGQSHFRVATMTSGSFDKSGLTTAVTTQPITFQPQTLTLVHLMSCCDHATVPTVTAGSIHFDLVVTHPTGEKRHWVFRAATEKEVEPTPITFTFEVPQSRVLWIVNSIVGAALGGNGADAVVQTAEQDSQTNANGGAIELTSPAAPGNAVFLFALAGSGAANDIVPGDGMKEAGQAETAGANLIIEDSWGIGPQGPLGATFVNDASGKSEIQSWLFLAAEIRGR